MSNPPSRAAFRGAVIVALASVLAATPSYAGEGSIDRPRTGFQVRQDGTAAGGWIGSRTAAKRAVFRIDPEAKPSTPGLRDARWRSELRGSGPVQVDRWRVRRAAWLVSKYGTYDSEAQAAAVEVALQALLHGGSHRLSGTETRRRLRQTDAATSVRDLARYMLDSSTRMAGPYRVRISATGAVIGGRARFAVEVTTKRTAEPIRYLPVDLRYDGHRLTGTTDAAGKVTVSAKAASAGPRPVSVRVSRVPSDQLFVRKPTRRGASRVVVAGRKIRLTRQATVAVQAQPRVWVTAPDVRTLRDPVGGSLHLAGGYPSPRQATLTLHGPFTSGDQPTCDPALAVATAPVPVSADGRYPAPAIRVSKAGRYRWSVSVPADVYNTAASRCGQSLVMKAVPSLAVTATDARIRRGAPAVAKVKAGSLPAGYSRSAIVRLYGPFASRGAARCTKPRRARWRSVDITAPSTTARTAAVTLGRPGFYLWQAVLPGTDLTTRVTTRCGAAGSRLRAR